MDKSYFQIIFSAPNPGRLTVRWEEIGDVLRVLLNLGEVVMVKSVLLTDEEYESIKEM